MAYYSFTKNIIEDRTIMFFNNGNMYRDFTYIDDIIDNIGNNRPVKLLDFIECLEREVGKPAIKEFYPMQPGDVSRTYADINDLIQDVDFKPLTPIQVGLSNFVKWYNA